MIICNERNPKTERFCRTVVADLIRIKTFQKRKINANILKDLPIFHIAFTTCTISLTILKTIIQENCS